jgi:hypothetical protein
VHEIVRTLFGSSAIALQHPTDNEHLPIRRGSAPDARDTAIAGSTSTS